MGSSIVQVSVSSTGTILQSQGAGVAPRFVYGARMVGEIIFWPQGLSSGSEPPGWLLCFGQAISRTTYSALFAVIGTSFGAGDGSTTFQVPDLRGRVIAGVDDIGSTTANRLVKGPLASVRHTVGGSGGSDLLAQNGNSGSGTASNIGTQTSVTGLADTAWGVVQPTLLMSAMIFTGV
jgi:microcystin-dependent protein